MPTDVAATAEPWLSMCVYSGTKAPVPVFFKRSAAIFRLLAERRVTLLVDEVDAIFAKRGRDDGNEDLRALLNAGYRRGATIPRCVGPRHEVRQFAVFCPVALAGLGELPDTLMSRSVIIRMRRRAPGEHVEPFRPREHEPIGHDMRDSLAAWAGEVADRVGAARPEMPPGIVDRPAELWEPLIAVADAAGGDWPALARKACVALAALAQDRRQSLGVRLLADLRAVFGEAIALSTRDILARLKDPEASGIGDDAPWADLNGVGLNERRLAQMLRPYGVQSRKVKTAGEARQGYRREDFADAWSRYLPAALPPVAEAELPEPAEPASNGAALRVPDQVPPAAPIRNPSGTSRAPEPRMNAGEVPEVPQVLDFRRGEGACPQCGGEGCRWCADGGERRRRL
jgi:hypothetical protein